MGKAWDSVVTEMKSGPLGTLKERRENGLSHSKNIGNTANIGKMEEANLGVKEGSRTSQVTHRIPSTNGIKVGSDSIIRHSWTLPPVLTSMASAWWWSGQMF